MGADQHLDWRQTAASALAWWHDAGVDTLVEDAPRDWLAQPAPSPRHAAPAVAPEPAPEALPDTLDAFVAWRLGAAAPEAGWGRLIGPSGDPASGLMILLDMPERDDAAAGALLSGEAGRLFDRMLAAIGRDRGSIYLASLAAARPMSRRMLEEQLAPLSRLALHHVGLVRPRRLLVMGDAASRALLGLNVLPARGNLHQLNHNGGQTETVASFHPRFLLDEPKRKAAAWKDLQLLMGGLDA